MGCFRAVLGFLIGQLVQGICGLALTALVYGVAYLLWPEATRTSDLSNLGALVYFLLGSLGVGFLSGWLGVRTANRIGGIAAVKLTLYLLIIWTLIGAMLWIAVWLSILKLPSDVDRGTHQERFALVVALCQSLGTFTATIALLRSEARKAKRQANRRGSRKQSSPKRTRRVGGGARR